jgi:hypothetical protein
MAKQVDERVACRTPVEGRDGVTNIPAWKFDLMRGAILKVLDEAGPEGMLNRDLRDAVGAELSEGDQEHLGKLGWHVVTVKLELEVRGEVVRMDGHMPLRIAAA